MAVASVGWRAMVRFGRSIRHERVRRSSAEPACHHSEPAHALRAERVVTGRTVDGRHCRPSPRGPERFGVQHANS